MARTAADPTLAPPVPGGSPAPPAGRALRVLAFSVLVLTGALVLLGSTVRVTESGMGCSSWPLCNGAVGPIDHFHPLLEQSHRYLAAAVTIGIVALALGARRVANRALRRWSVAAVGIVAVQVVLGAVTVLAHNAPATVAAHVVVGLLLLATVSLLAAASTGVLPDRPRPRGALAWGALGAALILLVSGSLVVDGGAAAACPSWPWCSAHPGVATHLVVIQLVHRSIAGATVVLVGLAAWRRRRATPARFIPPTLIGLLAAQVAAGALDALAKAPDALQDVHIGLAGAIWALVVVLVVGGVPELRPRT